MKTVLLGSKEDSAYSADQQNTVISPACIESCMRQPCRPIIKAHRGPIYRLLEFTRPWQNDWILFTYHKGAVTFLE